MSSFKLYKRKGLSEMRAYVPGEDLTNISVSNTDTPELGGMIARNPKNSKDQWYVAKKYFEDNLEEVVEMGSCQAPTKNLTFGLAIEALKLGKKVSRKGWNGLGMFLYLVPGSTFKVDRQPLLSIYEQGTEINYRPHLDLKTADGSIATWSPSGSDSLAEDWQIIG